MQRSELIEKIKMTIPGIDEKSIIEQAKYLIITGTHLMSYNDEVAISVPLKNDFAENLIAVNAKNFLKLLEKLSGDDISLSVSGNQLVVECGNTRSGFNIAHDVFMPDIGLSSVTKWHELPSDFSEALRFCQNTASTDASQGSLTCIHFQEDKATSCDLFSLARYSLSGEVKGEILIPRRNADSCIRHTAVKYAITESWVHLANINNVVYSIHQYGDEYRQLDYLLEIDGQKITLSNELRPALKRAEILASTSESGNKFCELEFVKGEILLRAENDDGWFEESIPREVDDFTGIIIADPNPLYQVISYTNSGIISEDNRKILFGGDKFKYLIALLEE